MAITYVKTELAPANNQLAAYLHFTSDAPVSYSYTVLKRTTSTSSLDFQYTSDEVILNVSDGIRIPVIGLYANYVNNVQVIFKDQSGVEVFNQQFPVSTEGQTYENIPIFHLDIEHTDPANFVSVWGNSWLMTSFCYGYDQNGDLRCYYAKPYHNQMLRIHNGYFYIGSDEDLLWYGRRFFKIDILGNVIFEFEMHDADGNYYENTHDLVWDSAGDLYMLGNDNPNRVTNTMAQDAWVLKFNNQTGKMIWAKNYTSAFSGSKILNNSIANDVHLNSLSWIPASTNNAETIIVHSRSTSMTFGISITDGSILWALDTGNYNPQFPSGETTTYIDTSGITDFENGAHTVCITTNSAFSEYNDPEAGKFVLSLFDNRSCLDTEGNPVLHPINDDPTTDTYQTDPVRILFYAVDLGAKTAVQIGNPIELPTTPIVQWTDFMGCVFDYNDYFTIFTNNARSFFISDITGKMVATIYDVISELDGAPVFPGEVYRARLFSETELSELITTASIVANS
ncbi:aryl-sulfate sulfotransferase [Citrobacter amalonaticus]|uniref:aryl-sulfate sulfotransferase n=1 Tax=Citrobacter amalonaticus TaxID=35703 RepID=UPI00255B1F12|nr:aryl-sulfate sulfotransferase [Citrobacter amalonaticus]MDL4619040.1 aryl-sulfate sulfotransferase [Citrobacter amalonaticus]MDL4623138.1 aryl-sulfate sulfotransferase [Citrobacter amalonaticus]